MKHYSCPNCGSLKLGVTILASAKLVQEDDGNLQTEVTGDHDWDHTHTMWCNDCGHCEGAVSFYNEPPKEST